MSFPIVLHTKPLDHASTDHKPLVEIQNKGFCIGCTCGWFNLHTNDVQRLVYYVKYASDVAFAIWLHEHMLKIVDRNQVVVTFTPDYDPSFS